jgi:hypothetical protein
VSQREGERLIQQEAAAPEKLRSARTNRGTGRSRMTIAADGPRIGSGGSMKRIRRSGSSREGRGSVSHTDR